MWGEGKYRLAEEGLGIYLGRKTQGGPCSPGRCRLCPGSWYPGSPRLWEQRCERAPPLDKSPWELLFVITEEQLFKQGAWGGSIFLIKCSPSPGPGRAGSQVQVPWLEPTPNPKGTSWEGPTGASYRWSRGGASSTPPPRADRQGGGDDPFAGLVSRRHSCLLITCCVPGCVDPGGTV